MTCNRTLLGCFASGRHTPILLFVFSLLLMLSAFWLPASVLPAQLPMEPPYLEGVASRFVSALLYAVSAMVISTQKFFDRRVRWVGSLYLCMVAIMLFANGNSMLALSSLLFVLSLVVLFACQYSRNSVSLLFTAFMVLGSIIFVTPFALYLLPLYLVFCFFVNIFSLRGLLASILGLLTPFWLALGTEYVLSGNGVLANNVLVGLKGLFSFSASENSLLYIMLLAFALILMLPAVIKFIGSALPAKTFLRRRLSFIMVADAYLLLLCCFVGDVAVMFYFWHLPFLAVLAAYLFSGKETKLMNVYFIFINIVMVAIATQSLWLKQ